MTKFKLLITKQLENNLKCFSKRNNMVTAVGFQRVNRVPGYTRSGHWATLPVVLQTIF